MPDSFTDKGNSMKRNTYAPSQMALAAGLAACGIAFSVGAADLGEIKIGVDQDVAARTNMPPRTDGGTLGVSFDQDVANRTNMGRQPGDVGTVTTAPDMALRERTNMGGVALQPQEPPKAAVAPPATPTKTQ